MIIKEKEKFVTIKNQDFKAIFCNVGASIYDITLNGKHMVMRPFKKSKFVNDNAIYNGKTAGRIAGRVPNSLLKFQDKTYKVDVNDGVNSLHGGKDGISTKLFSRSVKKLKDSVEVTFKYCSPNLEMGYPGKVDFTIKYTVDSHNSILIEFESIADCDTPVNLTNHCYYNLGGEFDATNHFLKGNVEGCYYAKDDVTIDINKLIKFKNTNLKTGCYFKDLVKEETFTSFFQKGVDHCFKFANNKVDLEVLSKKYKLRVTSDYPCFQMYSENAPVKGHLLNNFRFDRKYQALAIEPQEIPVKFDDMVSAKDQVKHRWVKLEFSRR